MLRDFIRSASHDLRTPLTIIQTKLELLRRTTDTTRQDDYADNMQEQIKHIERILAEFDTLSELLGQDGLQPGSIRINTLVKEAAENVRREYPDAVDITIAYDLEPAMRSIQADRRQLQLAIGGLIENALLYNRKDGHIKICTACDPVRNTVIIEVHDTGEGIDRESLQHIFDPFYKVNTARTRGPGRAGLGLSIVKRVVDWHQGRIEVESKPGEGSCFRVLLPAPAPG
jgi:two-component system phosphate regulon sensor histidine kinase PhoR